MLPFLASSSSSLEVSTLIGADLITNEGIIFGIYVVRDLFDKLSKLNSTSSSFNDRDSL